MKFKFLYIPDFSAPFRIQGTCRWLVLMAIFTVISNGCEKETLDEENHFNGKSTALFNPVKSYGTVTDQDGNVYKTITIGTQTWMAENLRTTKYRNGRSISEVTDNTEWLNTTEGAYCNYHNSSSTDTIATFGRLYNWYAVNDNRNIAPAGWHIPSDEEWTTLITYIGGAATAGEKLKETGISHWFQNPYASNESGFTALPAGFRHTAEGKFVGLGLITFWWSSTEADTSWHDNPLWASYRYVQYLEKDSGRGNWLKEHGFSVRCVKD
jgi:uncharacterized protein (TIGR02145 family)